MTRSTARALRVPWVFALAAFLPALTDWHARALSVPLDGIWDTLSLTGFDVARLPSPPLVRVGNRHSLIAIEGLGRHAAVAGEIYVAAAVKSALDLTVFVNRDRVVRATVGGRGRWLSFDGRADGLGTLRIQIDGQSLAGVRQAPRFWIAHAITVRQIDRALPPAHRLGYYLGFALLVAVAAAAGRRLWPPLVAPLLLAAGLSSHKALFVAILPGLALAALAAVVLSTIALRLGLARGAALGCALAGALRILAVLHPAFPSVDSMLHRHRLDQFRGGQLVTNNVGSDVERATIAIPYPPLAYALLSPFASLRSDDTLTRLAPAAVEASAPLLLFLLARALGAGPAAGWAALALAFMPEGMLVVAKGITANAVGLWAALWALLSLRQRNTAIAVGAWALACLGHPGITFGIALVGAAWAFAAWRSPIENPHWSRIALALAGGITVAWFVYYREAGAVGASCLRALVLEAQTMPRCFFALRWMNAGKLAQNLVLKYGAFVPLVWLGWRQLARWPALGTLVRAWLAAGTLQALLALVTPVAFRFEYFVAPAIALAITPIAAQWSTTRPRLLASVFLLSLVIQITLGWCLLQGRFDIINVIIPSNRWPLVGEGFSHLPGCDPSWPLAWW